MATETLIQRGNPGYSKQQMQLKKASGTSPVPVAPTNPVVPINPNQVATTINGKQYNEGGGLITNVQPTVSAPAVGNVSPYNIRPQQPSNAAAGGLEYISSLNQGVQKTAEEQRTQALKERELSVQNDRNDIGKLMQMIGQEGEYRNTAYQEQGVDTARTAVDDLTSQIEAEQLSNRRRVEEFQKNPGGISQAQVNLEVGKMNAESLSKQADLAIIQNAALRKYDTMKSIADRAVEAKMAPIKTALDIAKFFYEDNKADFTKEQDRMYQEKLKADERKYNKIEADAKALSDAKLAALQSASTQGAPISVQKAIQAAKTPEEVIRAAGQYGGDILERKIKQAQLDKVYADIRKTKSETITPAVISNVQSSQYKPALDVILGSKNFTKEQKASFIQAVNNGQDPFAVIKNQAISILGPEGKEVRNLEQAKAQVNEINRLLTQYYQNGGNTGIFKGGYEKALNKLGKVDDPNLVQIAVSISSALQTYRNAVSGTAYSVKEGQEISSVFPGINKSQGLNTAIIQGRINSFDTNIDAAYRSALGETYDQLKQTQVDPLNVIKPKQPVRPSLANPLGLSF